MRRRVAAWSSFLLAAALACLAAYVEIIPTYGEGQKAPHPASEPDPGKFDPGFYEKISRMIAERHAAESAGDKLYHGVVIVVDSDTGAGTDPDAAAAESKARVARHLEDAGARDIRAGTILSFVTASVPVSAIPGLALHDGVLRIGDGEAEAIPNANPAIRHIRATAEDMRKAANATFDGSGVVVAVVDSGVRHDTAFGGRVLDRVYCYADCRPVPAEHVKGWALYGDAPSDILPSHGTGLAGVIAASGQGIRDGIAQGASLLDAGWTRDGPADANGWPTNSETGNLPAALDWALLNGARVAAVSIGHSSCREGPYAIDLVASEAADRGMLVTNAAGNWGAGFTDAPVSHDRHPVYRSVTGPGCAGNGILVGGADNQDPSGSTVWYRSSKGPSTGANVLKPDIVASLPATLLPFTRGNVVQGDGIQNYGTSFASPQAAGVAALLFEARPDFTPLEAKASLLLGANWTGPIPCTSEQYERRDPADGCSYARQPATHAEAGSLSILNNAGFGIIDASQSLAYALPGTHILSGTLGAEADARSYSFDVDDPTVPVKVILSWPVHAYEGYFRAHASPAADLGFEVYGPGGEAVASADSAAQTNEFAVFYPSEAGAYVVAVTGTGMEASAKPVQRFALASTLPLEPLPARGHNSPPVMHSKAVVVQDGVTSTVLLRADDHDGDALSFAVTEGPLHGRLTAVEMVTGDAARIRYTPGPSFEGHDSFTVAPHDGPEGGRPANVTIVAESPPEGSSDAVPGQDDGASWVTLDLAPSQRGAASREFRGPWEGVTAVYAGAVNAGDAHVALEAGGRTHTIAAVAGGMRLVELGRATDIDAVTLHGGVDAYANPLDRLPTHLEDARVVAGLVSSPCRSTAAGAAPCKAPAYAIGASPGAPIPDGGAVASAVSVPMDWDMRTLSVSVNVTHPWPADLEVTLGAPGGSNVTLHNRTAGGAGGVRLELDASSHPGLAPLLGTGIAGDWTLYVKDHAAGDAGALEGWGMSASYAAGGSEALFREDFETDPDPRWRGQRADWAAYGPFRGSLVPSSGLYEVPALSAGLGAENAIGHIRQSLGQSCTSSRPCPIDVSGGLDLGGRSSAALSFWWSTSVPRSAPDEHSVSVHLRDASRRGAGWGEAFSWSASGGDAPAQWRRESVDLGRYVGSDDLGVRIDESPGGPTVWYDDITVSAAPPGPPEASRAALSVREDGPAAAHAAAQGAGASVASVHGGTLGAASHNGTHVMYEPRRDAHGSDAFQYVVVYQNGTEARGTVSVSIAPVNDPPAVVAAEERAFAAGEEARYKVPAHDPDDPAGTLNLEITGGHMWGARIVSGHLVWDAPASAAWTSHEFEVSASDGNSTAAGTLPVRMFDADAGPDAPLPPSLGPMPEQHAVERVPFAYPLPVAPGGVPLERLALEVTSGPAGADINSTGHFEWTPDGKDAGVTREFGISVGDGANPPATGTLRVRVAEANDPPVAPDASAFTHAGAGPLTIWPGVSDDTGANITSAEITTMPPLGSTTHNATHVIYAPGAAGTETVSYTAEDGGGLSDAGTITVHVAPDMPPELGPMPVQGATEHEPFAYLLPVSDDLTPVANMTFSVSAGGPFAHAAAGAGVNSTGHFEWVPGERAGGDEIIFQVFASDGGQAAGGALRIRVAEANEDPAFAAAPGPHEARVGEEFSIDLNATDPDLPAQEVTYAILYENATAAGAGGGAGPAVDPSTGNVTWTPAAAGIAVIVVGASDGFAGGPGTANITLRVAATGDGPGTTLRAADDAYAVDQDTATALDVLENDTVPAGGAAVAVAPGGSAQGARLEVNANSTIRYEPPPGYTGSDTFGYTVSAGGANASAAVAVAVRDTQAPEIRVRGAGIVAVPEGVGYTDAGAYVADNDPRYGGAISSNATAVDAASAGTYIIWYSAPPDAAGNAPAPAYRTVVVASDAGADVELEAGTHHDTRIAILAANVSVSPAPGASATLAGNSTVLAGAPGASVRGVEFSNITAPAAVRVTAPSGFGMSGSPVSGAGDGVVICDGPCPAYGSTSGWEESDAVCRVGAEECPAPGAGRAARQAAGATVTGISFAVGGHTVVNAGAGAVSATHNYHGPNGTVYGNVLVEPWYVDPGMTVLGYWVDAADDAFAVDGGAAAALDVLGNDAVPEGVAITVTAAGQSAHARLAVNPDNTIRYEPARGYSGADAFGYTVHAGGSSSSAAVTVDVRGAPGQAPAPAPDPVPAPAAAPAPRSGGGSGGGGGGGGGGAGSAAAGHAPQVYISSVSWDCGEGVLSVAAGPASAGIDVSVRYTSGVVPASPAGASGGLSYFEAPLGPAETFARVQATAVSGRGSSADAESVDIDGCAGSMKFAAPAPTAQAPQQPAAPAAREADRAAGAALAGFVAPGADPRSYVERYESDPAYREWFDEYYAGITIYEAVGLQEPAAMQPAPDPEPERAGSGAVPGDGGTGQGFAQPAQPARPPGGGCLIATAAYGTELAPQVQALREYRDGALAASAGGADLVSALSSPYYALSPAAADLQRESPGLGGAARALLSPALHAIHAALAP